MKIEMGGGGWAKILQLRRSFGDRELSEDRDGGGGAKILQLRRSFGDS